MLVGREGVEPPVSLRTPDLQSGALPLCHLPTTSLQHGTDRVARWNFSPRFVSRSHRMNTVYRTAVQCSPLNAARRFFLVLELSKNSPERNTRATPESLFGLWVHRLDSHQGFQGHNLASCSWTTTNTIFEVVCVGNEKEPRTDSARLPRGKQPSRELRANLRVKKLNLGSGIA
jgi:hypothetical protein